LVGLNFNPTNQPTNSGRHEHFRRHLLKAVYTIQNTYDFSQVIEEG